MIKKYVVILFILNFCFSQEIPQDLIEYQFNKLYFDLGENWEFNSTLDPVLYNNQIYHDSSRMHLYYGLYSKFYEDGVKGSSIYFYGRTQINKSLHFYFYPRIVTNPNLFDRYTGIARPRKRAGFNSGETDLAGVVYKTNNFEGQIARGRQIWGAGNNLDILLSENSASYDYFMLKFFYKNFQLRTFNGFLEKKDNHNRYISARAVEWSNKKTYYFQFLRLLFTLVKIGQ